MLEAAGYSCHVYTSPHLKRFRERIVLAGEGISETQLFEYLERCRLANEERPLTFFEGTTAAALLAFSEVKADVVLLETGMGGLNDPTNIIPPPRLAIITSISMDHMEYLGHTLEEIAAHKAGIIKEETPAIVSFQPAPVLDVLEKHAQKMHAPMVEYGKHWAVQKSRHGFAYADAYGQVEFPEPALIGPHQYINAGNAIAALSVLEEFEVTADHIVAGLKWVQWRGRLERVKEGPISHLMPTGWELWYDGGHNMAAGYMLSVALEQLPPLPLYIIFGTTRGKDVTGLLKPLEEAAMGMFAVPVQAEPKCYTPQEIADACEDAGIRIQIADGVEEAIEAIIAQADQPSRILVFGSLYLALEVLDL
jgi:dihydrofolate synthase / folylpolyglutamate synthase